MVFYDLSKGSTALERVRITADTTSILPLLPRQTMERNSIKEVSIP
jgi:hypothetical protein